MDGALEPPWMVLRRVASAASEYARFSDCKYRKTSAFFPRPLSDALHHPRRRYKTKSAGHHGGRAKARGTIQPRAVTGKRLGLTHRAIGLRVLQLFGGIHTGNGIITAGIAGKVVITAQ